jgi:hypothetical protein
MVGFDRSPVPAKPGGGKKKKGPKKSPKKRGRKKEPPPKKPKPTPSATSSPTPAPDFTIDCFEHGGGFFLIPVPATGPGVIGGVGGFLGLGNVPNVPGLTRVTQEVTGVSINNYQAVADNLRRARDFMANSAFDSNQLGNQRDVIDCFEGFCKKQGWPVF